MSIVEDLCDEHQAIRGGMVHWLKYWRTVASYVLPQTEDFTNLITNSPSTAIGAVGTSPVAYEKSKHIYDMTSIWAVERLAAGIISLKTPETSFWHGLSADDEFGTETNHEEMVALEKVRNYQFAMRSNPRTGFWPAHRAAIRSMCAFGDGWLHVPEVYGQSNPWRYEYMPLPELAPSVDSTGAPDMMYRSFMLTARQIAEKFAGDNPREAEKKVGAKVVKMANDPEQRHTPMPLLHGVRPRSDNRRLDGPGVLNARFESHYCLPDEKHHIGESGFFDFPFIRYAWSNVGAKAQSEGPVAYALGEIKSLQEMSRNELIASQQAIRPPLGTHGKNFGRVNFNPGAMNHGLVNPEGRPLFAPLNGGARPDFAQSVIEARRNSVRETMYLNLWQILIEQGDQTATEAMIRAQEKGELLGPVGISLNAGLHSMVEREMGIMQRRGAFDEGSPLELPASLVDRDTSPRWTSPLDRLRQMGEMVGMQRLAAFAGELAASLQDPSIAKRINPDAMIDKAQEVLGAPAESLVPVEDLQDEREQAGQLGQMQQILGVAQQGGDALKTLGEGAGAAAALPQAAQPGGAV